MTFPKALIDAQVKSASHDVLRFLHTCGEASAPAIYEHIIAYENLTEPERIRLAKHYIWKALDKLRADGLIKYRGITYSLTVKGKAYKLPPTLEEANAICEAYLDGPLNDYD